MEVREVQPANAACIIETDCEVDFEPPPGYVEPSSTKPAGEAKAEVAKEFGGAPAPVGESLWCVCMFALTLSDLQLKKK